MPKTRKGVLMQPRKVRLIAFALLTALFGNDAFAQTAIPIRNVTPLLATSRDTFGIILTARQLPGGRVLVNDAKRHRLLLLDSSLRTVRVVLDSIAGETNYYGQRPEPTIPYLGDSTIFVDHASRTLILIDPNGNVGRAISPPTDREFLGTAASSPGLDSKGRVLYRGYAMGRDEGKGVSIEMRGAEASLSNADSNPIIRGDFETRKVDTVAALQNLNAYRDEQRENGNVITRVIYLNPMRTGDEWTVTSDGTIAVVRGHDYHVDWITADGQKTSTAKLPFDWKSLTSEEKEALRQKTILDGAKKDSINRAMRGLTANGEMVRGAPQTARTGGAGTPDMQQTVYLNQTTSVPVKEMPDYVPAIRVGSVRGDQDNNVWILPSTSARSIAGELVYDVVNRKGELFQRVRMPVGRSIVGFGKGGVLFLANGNLTQGFVLERVRIVDR